MKKTSMLKGAALAVAAVMSVGAAFAAYNAITETKTNTFSIVADEKDKEVTEAVEEPSWNAEDAKDLQPGEAVNKDPQLKNVTDYDAYGYLVVSVPVVNGKTASDDAEKVQDAVTLGELGANWSKAASYEATEAGKSSVYIFKNSAVLTPNSKTSAVFSKFTVKDFTKLSSKLTGSIDVVGYLFQSEGFDAEAALASVKASAEKKFSLESPAWN